MTTAVARFYSKTRREGACLIWTGALTDKGYGRFFFKGKIVAAHRWLYQHLNGPLPPDVLVRHRCDTPPCVEPSHLLPGGHVDNARDRVERGRDGHRKITHCPAGHRYDEQNTYVNRRGFRECRRCLAARKRSRRHKMRAGD